jgi:large subunit ribosomal protein L1
MGKTKTAFVGGVSEEAQSSEEKYKQKLAKKKAEEEKRKVAGGLKDEEKNKVVETQELPSEEVKAPEENVPETSEVVEEKETAKEKKIRARGKNYKGAKSKVDANKLYPILDAIKLIKSLKYTKFDETYELHIMVKKQGLNINLNLPHPFGKTKKVEVASDATIDKLKAGKVDFDILLATPEMMPKLVMFAKLLGPKGLMPNPKNGTLIKSDKEAEKYSVSQTTIKTEKEQPIVHTAVGKMSMDEGDIAENIQVIFDAISKNLIDRVYLKSTMSPSVKVLI